MVRSAGIGSDLWAFGFNEFEFLILGLWFEAMCLNAWKL